MSKFGHSGDLGDIIFCLPILQQLGGKHVLRLYDRPFTKKLEERAPIIAPLLLAQPYIEEVLVGDGPVDYDFAPFRKFYQPSRTLLAAQGAWMKKNYGMPIPKGERPWLTVTPSKATKGLAVVARSARYHNPHFPWQKIVDKLGSKIRFVGISEEYEDFCSKFGEVEHLPTANLLEVAQAIAGSDLFIGNQSSPGAVAEGLKHPRIQETSLRVPDCIYPGGGYYCENGTIPFLGIEGSFSGFRERNPSEVPPGLWQWEGQSPQFCFSIVAGHVAKEMGVSLDEAEKLVYTYNCQRVPDYFRRTNGDSLFSKVTQARQNA